MLSLFAVTPQFQSNNNLHKLSYRSTSGIMASNCGEGSSDLFNLFDSDNSLEASIHEKTGMVTIFIMSLK